MTDKTIQVVALVVDNGILTFYRTDGSVFTVTQGDPRGGALSDEFFAQKRLGKEVVDLVIGTDDMNTTHLTSKKRSPLIRFFRALKSDVEKLFGKDTLEHEEALTEESHEAAAQKVRDVAARLFASADNTADSTSDLPVKLVHSEDPMTEDETIIAVTKDGVVPGVENLSDQFQAGEEGKAPAQGPDNLIKRLATMSAKRGHTAKELMDFIKKIDLPILPDGSFLAYKRLRHIGNGVYVDPHTSLVHQRIGDIVQMDEKLVDPSKRYACSQGLHIGSRHYMGGFHANVEGSGTMLVLVQPEDAIAVPPRDSKARVCRYQILADLSNKAHNLVNNKKRMDDCADTMKVVAQIVAGARPAPLGVVNIGAASGGNLTYHIGNKTLPTNTSLGEARAIAGGKATEATSPVVPVRTIDDEKQGNRAGLTPVKVRDSSHKVSPTAAREKAAQPAEPVRVQVAAQLYGRMTDKKNTDADRLAAATELKAHKQRCKVSYEALKLPKETANDIEEIITVASPTPSKADPKPSKPAPSKPQAKKTEPVKTAPQPKAKAPAEVKAKPEPKAEAPKAPQNESRGDKARRLWANATDSKLSGNHQKQALEELVKFKKAAKVSWEKLGLYTHSVEAEMKKRGL